MFHHCLSIRITSPYSDGVLLTGTNSDAVSVWELEGLGQEQHFRATEAFGTITKDVSVWDLVG